MKPDIINVYNVGTTRAADMDPRLLHRSHNLYI